MVCAYLLTGAEEASLRTLDTEGAILYGFVVVWEAGEYARRVEQGGGGGKKGGLLREERDDEEAVGLIALPARECLGHLQIDAFETVCSPSMSSTWYKCAFQSEETKCSFA